MIGKVAGFKRKYQDLKNRADLHGRDFHETAGQAAKPLDLEGRLVSIGDFSARALASCLPPAVCTIACDVELFPAWVVST